MPLACSLLGELDDDEEEDEEKPTPLRPGGFVAVFCPVRLLRHTGQLSCCVGERGCFWRGGGEAVWAGQAAVGWGRAAHLLQPGHNAAVVEEVVAGQLSHALPQHIIVLAHGALEAGACAKQGVRVRAG